MQASPELNDHRIWNDQDSSSNGERHGQTSFTPRQAYTAQMDLESHLSPQGGIIASSSDDLFHPVSGIPTTSVYTLPDVPFNPNPHYHAYIQQPNRISRPLPTISSSYNNPSFTIPPPPDSNILRNNSLSINPLGPPPPLPPCPRMLPLYNQHQPYYPTYNAMARSIVSPSPSASLPVLAPSSPLSLSTSSSLKPLPSVTHIPLLTSKLDFFAWDEGVTSLIRANGLIGHVLDPSEPVDPSRPDRVPTLIPTLSMHSTPQNIAALNQWWDDDNIVQHILVSRLSSIARGLLPSPNLITRTALSIYKMLVQYYGTCSFADCTELMNTLNNTPCTNGRVTEHVSKWRIGIARLQTAKFPFSIKVCISQFVRGLPLIAAFIPLRAELPYHIATAGDQDFGAFIALTETVLELDAIFRMSSHAQNNRSNRTPATTTSSNPPASTSTPTSNMPETASRSSKMIPTCTNCKARGLRFTGHNDSTCFQPGGGMEGRRDEYLSNKGRVHAMFVEYLENALDLSESSSQQVPDSRTPPLSPTLPIALDDEVIIPPIANLCVPTYAPNTDLTFDLYTRRDYPSMANLHLAYPTVDFTNSALVSLVSLFNALLDSGCTHHIIRDRDLFYNYIDKEISVGTANCGSLEALGTGDVDFRCLYGDRNIVFTLRGCLFAPTAPINLLSVGALVERGMSCLFSPGGITKVFFPKDHTLLPGFTFRAKVSNRLSFLKLDFISRVKILSSVVSPIVSPVSLVSTDYSFPHIKPDLMLWHRRFGHIGMDATRAALTKEYVTGIQYEGPLTREHCVACLIGKSPQQSYSHHGNRATAVGELLHMDLCGPYPTQGPRGEKYFYNILDDKSNFGFTFGLRMKSDAFSHYQATEAFLERSSGVRVLTIRCGGELELMASRMGDHLTSKGVVVQRTVPYAHEQNGKSERYIRTLEEGGQALLADSGLPTSFWLDAVLTRQYLCNRLPTSTLPNNVTPFESITNGRKPNLSHLRVWGCECYVAIPSELRPKAGFKRFRAIFVGYEEHRVGWRVRDLKGKYSFSNDVIFNESLSGRLGIPRSLSSPATDSSVSPVSRLPRDTPRIRTAAGQAYDEIIRLKEFRNADRDRKSSRSDAVMNGGEVVDDGVVVVNGGAHGGAHGGEGVAVVNDASEGELHDAELSSYFLFSSFLDQIETESLGCLDVGILHRCLTSDHVEDTELDTVALRASVPSHLPSFNLSKAPSSYAEAVARPDEHIWHAAMSREMISLGEMGAFEETDLPEGERTIGLKWVFAHKTDPEGVPMQGKEKARLVAQGFNQRPGQYDDTYAPVAKIPSVRILLAWAAVRDLEIFQFDCKTAFLHAKIQHPIYARQIPGYPLSNPKRVLRILVALYGLRQSAFEFYTLFSSLLLDLGMLRCELDHGVFVGEWMTAPDPSVPMPIDGTSLVLYVPLHVDDGLAITNSSLLYAWFLKTLAKRLLIVDLGHCSKFLSIVIIRDRPNRRLWLSSHVYISELLDEWNLASCKAASTPFPSSIFNLSPAPLNSLPDISDTDLTPKYQRIVGCLLYLAVATRPDIAYYAMWLGQYSAKPSRAHFLAAKHVLRYLSGTKQLALCLGSLSSRVPAALRGYMQNVGCSDADWASDATDRKSISGYSFYFEGSLVSWSAVKQKSIALSSTEAEYYAMTHAFKEALWLCAFLRFLKFPVPQPFPILSDNQAACSLSNSLAISARSKHIDIRHHFIREHVRAGTFSTTWLPTEDMPADIFTKVLSFPIFSRHRDVLGLSIPSSLL